MCIQLYLGKRLNEYISHYEPLNYDEKHINANHNRAKRSVTKDPHVLIKFKAHGRRFHFRLKRDISTFSDNLVVCKQQQIYNYYILLKTPSIEKFTFLFVNLVNRWRYIIQIKLPYLYFFNIFFFNRSIVQMVQLM